MHLLKIHNKDVKEQSMTFYSVLGSHIYYLLNVILLFSFKTWKLTYIELVVIFV